MNDYGGEENIIISCTVSQHKAAYLCNLFQFNESNNTPSPSIRIVSYGLDGWWLMNILTHHK